MIATLVSLGVGKCALACAARAGRCQRPPVL